MLQPRELLCVSRKSQKLFDTKRTKLIRKHIWECHFHLLIVLTVIWTFPAAYTQNVDAFYGIEASPALQIGREDLTTVVLVNNDNGRSSIDHHGRHLNLRPEIGLLTSTARTFIQEGVTTEYATQVVGTTLDNGRLYAQYLKKSSRVLYDQPNHQQPLQVSGTIFPSVITSWVGESTSIFQSHNDLLNADQPDWGDIDDSLLVQRNSFIGNTDYIGINGKLNGNSNKAYNGDSFVVDPPIETRPSTDGTTTTILKSDLSIVALDSSNIVAKKVLPVVDLPTYTVMNTFSPSGISYDTTYSKKYLLPKNNVNNKDTTRSPKVFYKQLLLNSVNDDITGAANSQIGGSFQSRNSAPAVQLIRSFSTVTYYGFADFTTTVGDSVIVFSPSTAMRSLNMGQITSIKGEATLDRSTSSTSHLSIEPITAMQYDAPSLVSPTITQKVSQEKTESVKENVDSLLVNVNSIDVLSSEVNLNEQQQESQVVTTASQREDYAPMDMESMLSKPTNEEVLKIYASLSKANEYISLTKATTQHPHTEKEIKTNKHILETSTSTHGGATTIFFEDDPFMNFVEQTSMSTAQLETTIMPISENSVEQRTEMLSTLVETDITESTTTLNIASSKSAVDYNDVKDFEIFDQNSVSDTTTTATTHTTESVIPDITAANIVDKKSGFNVKEIDIDKEIDPNCIRTSQVFLTQLPKTITQLTTFLITNEQEKTIETSTGIHLIPSFEISQATKHYCLQPASSLQKEEVTTAAATTTLLADIPTSTFTPQDVVHEETTIPNEDEQEDDAHSLAKQTDEPDEVTDETIDSSEISDTDDEEEKDESGEEIELLYKTLFTTYTYLTTFFHEDKTRISSHTEIVTNVITSTLRTALIEDSDYDENVSKTLLDSFSTQLHPIEIAATKSTIPNETTTVPIKFMVPQELENLIRHNENYDTKSADENDKNTETYKANDLLATTTRTYYTTYTYYTTIFAEGDTEIMSRTEVYTNLVVGSTEITPTEMVTNEVQRTDKSSLSKIDSVEHQYSTMISSTKSLPDLNEYSKMITLVTDVRSSSSNGEKHIINRNPLENRPNDHNQVSSQQDPIEDQISSETNNGDINVENIIPSATLLLQTSFTTFTYYTTMYSGDNTNIISRLETITNVVTETLKPTSTSTANVNDDSTLPITYYTTYTYWTKLAKNGDIQTISREETISNIVTPTNVVSIAATNSPTTNDSVPSPFNSDVNNYSQEHEEMKQHIPMATTSVLEPTTFYTTYTYYTTSYEIDQTITDSRFETVTNVVTPTITIDSVATNVADLIDGQLMNEQTSTSSLDMSPSHGLTSSLVSAEDSTLLYDYKKIIDADGVSTLHFTTQILNTVGSDGLPSQAVSSTSSLNIDEEKRLQLLTSTLASESSAEPVTGMEIGWDGLKTFSTSTSASRQYKTGLVRLIEGTRIANLTTTLYQSKVIGTFIDNRYAQIIESTSSFLFNTQSSSLLPQAEPSISPSIVQHIDYTSSPVINSVNQNNNLELQSTLVESSIDNDFNTFEDAFDTDDGLDEENIDDSDNSKARYPFQSRKRTFTPVIRPFASRNRPQFAPKKKLGSPSSATIITRSDFTPTITATPALKATGLAGSSRRGGGNGISNISGSYGGSPTRRFGRPSSKTLQSGGSLLQTSTIINSFGISRSRLSNTGRVSLGSSLKRGSNSQIRPSTSGFRGSISSGFAGISRLRIRPTASLGFAAGQQTTNSNELFTSTPISGDNSVEDAVEDTPESDEGKDDNTTDNSKLSPTNRLRRPIIRPSGFTTQTGNRPTPVNPVNNGFSLRRNPLTARGKSTTSTTTTTTTTNRPRTFQRPTIGTSQNRARPQNSLFPPRGLFNKKINTVQSEDTQKQNKTNDLSNKNSEDESDYDDDDEEDEVDDDGEEEVIEEDTNRRKRSNLNQRVRRDAEGEPTSVQTRSQFRNRFRRPTKMSTDGNETAGGPPVTTSTSSPRKRSRLSSRYGLGTSTSMATTTASSTADSLPQGRSIRPTRPSSGRAQFTLREKDATTSTPKSLARKGGVVSFPRRPQTSNSSRRKVASSSPSTAVNNRRLKSYSNNISANESPSRSSVGSRSRTLNNGSNNNRNRGSNQLRSRNNHHRNEYGNSDNNFLLFDGTITVTYVVPSDVTIPVVNGKITEYKNVVTAKTSTEVLSPKQYTTFTGTNGMETLALTRHESSINYAGATEVTQYILHETATTTVTFTPTTIRGRKTSFSHVIPSTVFSVETIVSTTQPQIAANAPLANILLSQLLLGNIGLPSNPLVGGGGGSPGLGASIQPTLPATPVTEYRTHTSTYVTTVFEGSSTILPVTFLGKKILTTVYDTTANTITATEFITDTIVTTPTQVQQQQQPAGVNSLLLQQLLLQQQLQPQLLDQQQHQQLGTLPILNSIPPQFIIGDNLQDLDTNSIQHSNEKIDIDNIPIVMESQTHKSGRKKSRKNSSTSTGKRNRKHHNNNRQNNEYESSSVITLYVSGRRPGEFSTILSTVQAGHDFGSVYKRETAASEIIEKLQKTAIIDSYRDFYETDGSEIVNEYMVPNGENMAKIIVDQQAIYDKQSSVEPLKIRLFESQSYGIFDDNNNVDLEKKDTNTKTETQTLESIVGDVNHWYTLQMLGQTTVTKISKLTNDKIGGVIVTPPVDTFIDQTHFFA